MSDAIKHECGLAFIRLRKPLRHYQQKYGTAFHGINKLFLLMEKQHNRGQDGAGVGVIKLDPKPGTNYIDRIRSTDKQAIQKVVEKDPAIASDVDRLKTQAPFLGEVLLGHLRYATYGSGELENCHPRRRLSNWITRNLVLAGNFNMTNVDELFDLLVGIGQCPKEKSDTMTVLEKIGHYLDVENDRLRQIHAPLGETDAQLTRLIGEQLDVAGILRKSAPDFRGG